MGKRGWRFHPQTVQTLKRLLTVLFFLGVTLLIYTKAKEIDWSSVWGTLTSYRLSTLFTAGLLSLVAYLLYSLFDLLSKKHIQHDVSSRNTFLIAFISYAFNQNFGAWVGGIAFRYRLYAQFGLNAALVSRVIGFSIISNWTGYVLLTGLTLILEPLTLPPSWGVGPSALRSIGAALFTLAIIYFSICFFSTRRRFNIFKTEIELPSSSVAISQVLVSVLSWLSIATVLYILFQKQISFSSVLGAFLASGIVAVIAHIPAGIGVLEAVIVTLLSDKLPASEILAAVLAFRAIYYLGPLSIALVLYLLLELRMKQKSFQRPVKSLAL